MNRFIGVAAGMLALVEGQECVAMDMPRFEVLPIGGWRYTTTAPGEGWQKAEFDAAGWKDGVPGFGNRGLPPAQQSQVRSEWTTPDIWVRAPFQLDRIPERPALRLSYDEDVEVFINGTPVCGRKGYISDYAVVPLDDQGIRALRQGTNTLAAHCHQTIGGQFLDVQFGQLILPPKRTLESIVAELGAVPRSEHPRPDMERPHWANLNGVWEFGYSESEMGLKILVPFCPESVLSGLNDEEFHKTCCYARNFDVPQELQGQRVLLHFGAVDYRADVTLNGQRLGQHEGGYQPFDFDVTTLLKPTGNRLIVRVEDNPQESKPKGKQSSARYPSGCVYMRTTGIWQTVWLEAVGSTFVRDWVLTADPDTGVVKFRARTDGPGQDLRLAVVVSRDGKETARGVAAVAAGAAEMSLTVLQPVAWSPDNPALYDLDLVLQAPDGREVDRVRTYCGFRKIETRDGMYHLNGKPFFLISALDQGYYLDGLYTPKTDEAQRRDVEWAKRYGLNSIRKHQIVAEPRFLYWCDRLGLTVWGEMPDWGASLLPVERFLREWQACMCRDINHPCIITWVPTNERTAPDDDASNRAKVAIYEATKALDPTRPVIDTSGYCHTKTDVVDLHVNPRDGDDCRKWWQKWRESIAASGNFPAYPDRPAFCKGFRYQGQPVIFSETGNWRITELPPMGLWAPYGYGPLATVKDYVALYRDFFLALMSEPDCAGFSYVQVYDVEGEVNGYLTYDRQPKVAPEVIAGIHAEGLRLRAAARK